MVNDERLMQIKQRLQAYYSAEIAVLSGQKYTIGTRSLERADLTEIRKAIAELETLRSALEGTRGARSRRVVPRDV